MKTSFCGILSALLPSDSRLPSLFLESSLVSFTGSQLTISCRTCIMELKQRRRRRWEISPPSDSLQLVKSPPFGTSEACKRYHIWAEPPHTGRYREYHRGLLYTLALTCTIFVTTKTSWTDTFNNSARILTHLVFNTGGITNKLFYKSKKGCFSLTHRSTYATKLGKIQQTNLNLILIHASVTCKKDNVQETM